MTPAPAPLDRRDDVWHCGPGIPDVSEADVECILDHPPSIAAYTGEPGTIVPMARFMVALANDFVACYVRALGCLDLAVRADPAGAGLVLCLLARLPPAQWRRSRFVLDGCAANLPGDRERLRAAVSRGRAARADLAEFDVWHARARAALRTADAVEARLERARREFGAHPVLEIESLDRLTVGRCVATTAQLGMDEARCVERMRAAAAGCGRQTRCVVM